MPYAIRRPNELIATLPTFGEAFEWANEHTELAGGVGIWWGTEGSAMSLVERRDWANRHVDRLELSDTSTELLRAKQG